MPEQYVSLDVRLEQMVGAETAESYRQALKRWENNSFNQDMLNNQVTETLDRGGEPADLKRTLESLLLIHTRG